MDVSKNENKPYDIQDSELATFGRESPLATNQDWALTALLNELPKLTLSCAVWSQIFGRPLVDDNFVPVILSIKTAYCAWDCPHAPSASRAHGAGARPD